MALVDSKFGGFAALVDLKFGVYNNYLLFAFRFLIWIFDMHPDLHIYSSHFYLHLFQKEVLA